jgi:hypothetical protein
MLHEIVQNISSGKNVYVNDTWVCSNHIGKGKMFMWMLHEFVQKISTRENVYVNVTWVYLKDIDWGKCLCKCYMSLFKGYEQWKMFMWMLHEFI